VRGRSGIPRAVFVAAAVWVLYGLLLISTSFGGGSASASDADPDSVSRIQGQLGAGSGGAGGSSGWSVAVPLLGVGVVLLAAVLLIGRGWTRHLLVLLGVAGVVLLAVQGFWQTLPAMVLLVVGAVPLMLPSAHRFMSRRSTSG
jgi:hypothetical protein